MENDWAEIKKKFPLDSLTKGIVMLHAPYGIFVNLRVNYNIVGFIDLIDFVEEGPVNYEDYPKFNSEIEVVVVGYNERNSQIRLSLKPSDLKKAREEQKNKS
jgi:ribosomal protein S1